MQITTQALDNLFTGYKASFKKGFEGAPSHWQKVAMKVTSSTRQETYAWLGQFPKMREWLGDRVINRLKTTGMIVINKNFEDTVAVPKNDIEDDVYGTYSPLMEEMGLTAAELPDELVFSMLVRGFTTLCYDGQPFFAPEHLVGEGAFARSVANMHLITEDNIDNPAWFLLDTSRAVRPLIFQERRPPNFVSKDDERDDNVFFRKEYIYGVDSRGDAALGFWQLAWGSKQPLSAASYEEARVAMQSHVGDEGRPLGVKPTLLVVGPALESAAKKLIGTVTLENGESNPWYNSVEVLVTPWARAA